MKFSEIYCYGFPLDTHTLTRTDQPHMSSVTSPSLQSRPNTGEPQPAADPEPSTPDRLGVLPWIDPTQDGGGHDARSAYVETFWLPTLGPSTTLLLRRLADEFDAQPQGFEIHCASLSREIGLGPRMDKRGAFARTIERCVKFNMVQVAGDLLYVRRRVPNVSHRQLARLSPRLQTLHADWTIDPEKDGAAQRTELVRAAHLARTLLALGETAHDAEKQLHRWHFAPGIAWHAVQWALADPELLA